MRIRFTRNAVADLDEIWLYVAREQSIEAAEQLLHNIAERFTLLAHNPGVGRARLELREGVRSYVMGRYRIYYALEPKGIVRILHVRHAARNERGLYP